MASLSIAPGYGAEQRRGPKIDWFLVLATCILVTVGLMSLYSEGITHDNGGNFRKQLLNTIIGLVPFSVFAFVPPRVWSRIAGGIYALNITALLFVLVKGVSKNGSERWIQLGSLQVQPSELAKILLVLTLAAFYSRRQSSIQKMSTFWLGIVHVMVPAALVLMQPHLGAAMVMIVTWFAISCVAGVPGKFMALATGALVGFALLVVVAISVPAISSRLLQPYQLKRVQEMFSNDSKKGNYQTDRAEIAFGVGGVSGTGYLKGEQKQGHFIPEQNDDFIFTVIGEEGGLIGCTLVLMAYGFFFYRLWLVMFHASDPYYKMIVGGLFASLGFHMFVNMAMVLHIVPVVGLWLPFVSYGGSAMWMCMSAVALALNIRARERRLLF